MTKEEIIDKINTGIRGQGSMVDIGGVLADVLTELANEVAILERARQYPNIEILLGENALEISNTSEAETARTLGLPVEVLRRLISYGGFVTANGAYVGGAEDASCIAVTNLSVEAPAREIMFAAKDRNSDNIRAFCGLRKNGDGTYSFIEL